MNSLDLKLKNFFPDDEANKHWMDPNAGHLVEIKFEDKPPPYIIFIIFVYLKKYSFGGQWEKVNWEIPIKYKNVPMMLAHKKFGFQIKTYSDKPEAAKIAIEALRVIKKAIPTAEKLIEPIIKSQVDSGKITISNDYYHLRSRYEYFREKAERHLKNTKNEDFDFNSFEDHMVAYNALLKEQNKGYNYAVAMIDAYFSLLEHILVLIKPFIMVFVTESDLSKFVGQNWGEKYKTLFDISKGGSPKIHYDAICEVKERYRNIAAHGNFQKGGGSFKVHMPHIGAIPMSLTKSKTKTHFIFSTHNEFEFVSICNVFDDFDNFLDSSSISKYGMMYIKSGLPVVFNDETKGLYSNAMKSEQDFNDFIEYMEQEFNNALNMDW
ncbi:MAG: hypothetical protein ABIK92_12655 [Pseudomonadota bacterium]